MMTRLANQRQNISGVTQMSAVSSRQRAVRKGERGICSGIKGRWCLKQSTGFETTGEWGGLDVYWSSTIRIIRDSSAWGGLEGVRRDLIQKPVSGKGTVDSTPFSTSSKEDM
jgi:hypothetical protein